MAANGGRMKVTILSYDFGEYCIRLASALASEAAVQLILPEGLAAPHLSKLSPDVAFVPFAKPRLRQPLQQLQVARIILKEIGRFDPDVVHLQQGHLWFNLALPLLKRYPLVLTVHDARQHLGDRGAQKTPQAFTDFGFRRGDQLIAHAERLKQIVIDGCGVAAELVHVIPHIELGDETAPERGREEGNLVLFFGRIWPYKGLEYLIRAEPLISARVPDVRIVIAGEGESFDRYRRMMVHPDRFRVLNQFVPDDACAELFRRSSVVALPYIEASQSGVIPLAYSFAKPVVATTVGGLPEMVEDGRTGYLVPPHDERALADAIVLLLQDPARRRQFGANGRRKIETECSGGVIAEATLAVYHRAISAHRSRKAVTS